MGLASIKLSFKYYIKYNIYIFYTNIFFYIESKFILYFDHIVKLIPDIVILVQLICLISSCLSIILDGFLFVEAGSEKGGPSVQNGSESNSNYNDNNYNSNNHNDNNNHNNNNGNNGNNNNGNNSSNNHNNNGNNGNNNDGNNETSTSGYPILNDGNTIGWNCHQGERVDFGLYSVTANCTDCAEKFAMFNLGAAHMSRFVQHTHCGHVEFTRYIPHENFCHHCITLDNSITTSNR